QSSATALVTTSTSAPPADARSSGTSGSSPGAPYTAYSTTAAETSTSSTPFGASSSSSARTSSACSRRTRTAMRVTGGPPCGSLADRRADHCTTARRITARPPSGAQKLVPEGALELSEHALVGAQVVLGHRLRQLLEQHTLLPVQVPWDHDVDDD